MAEVTREYVLRFFVDVIERMGKNVAEDLKNQFRTLALEAIESERVFQNLAKQWAGLVKAQKDTVLSSERLEDAYRDMVGVVAAEQEELISADKAFVRHGRKVADVNKEISDSLVNYTNQIEKLEAQAYEKELAGQAEEARKLYDEAEALRAEQTLLTQDTKRLSKALQDQSIDYHASVKATKIHEEALRRLAPYITLAREEYTKFGKAFVPKREPIDILALYVANLINMGKVQPEILRNVIESRRRTSEWYDSLAKTYGISKKELPRMYDAFKNVYASVYDVRSMGKGFTTVLDAIREKGVSVEELPDYFWAVVKTARAAKEAGLSLSEQLEKIRAGEFFGPGAERAQSTIERIRQAVKEFVSDTTGMAPKVKKSADDVDESIREAAQSFLKFVPGVGRAAIIISRFTPELQDMIRASEFIPEETKKALDTFKALDPEVRTLIERFDGLSEVLTADVQRGLQVAFERFFALSKPAQQLVVNFSKVRRGLENLTVETKRAFDAMPPDVKESVEECVTALAPFFAPKIKLAEEVEKAASETEAAMPRVGESVKKATSAFKDILKVKKWMTPAETYFTRIASYVPESFRENMIEAWDVIKKRLAIFPTWREKQKEFVRMLLPTGIPREVLYRMAARTYFPPMPKPRGLPPKPPELPGLPPETIETIIKENVDIFKSAKKAASGTREFKKATAETAAKVPDLTREQEYLVYAYLREHQQLEKTSKAFERYLETNKDALKLTDAQIAYVEDIARALAYRWVREQERASKSAVKFGWNLERLSSRMGFFGWVTIYTGRFVINTLKQIWSAIDDVMKIGAKWQDNIKTLATTLGLMSAAGLQGTEAFRYLQDQLMFATRYGLEMQTAYMMLHSVLIGIQQTLAYLITPAFMRFAEVLATVAQTEEFQAALEELARVVESQVFPQVLDLIDAFISSLPAILTVANAVLGLLRALGPLVPVLMAFGIALWTISPVLKIVSYLIIFLGKVSAATVGGVSLLTFAAAKLTAAFNALGIQVTITATMIKVALGGILAAVSILGIVAIASMTRTSGRLGTIWRRTVTTMNKDTIKAGKNLNRSFGFTLGKNVLMTKQAYFALQRATAAAMQGYEQVTAEGLLATQNAWAKNVLVVRDSSGEIMYIIDKDTNRVYNKMWEQVGTYNETTGEIKDLLTENVIAKVDESTKTVTTSATTISVTLETLAEDFAVYAESVSESLSKTTEQMEQNREEIIKTIKEELEWERTTGELLEAIDRGRRVFTDALGLLEYYGILTEEQIESNKAFIDVFERLTKAEYFTTEETKILLEYLQEYITYLPSINKSFIDWISSLLESTELTEEQRRALQTLLDAINAVIGGSPGLMGMYEALELNIKSMSELGDTMRSMCFTHLAPQVERLSSELEYMNEKTAETLDNMSTLSGIRTIRAGVVGAGISATGEVVQHVTVYVYVTTGPISAEVDLDKLTDSVNRGVAEALRRRL